MSHSLRFALLFLLHKCAQPAGEMYFPEKNPFTRLIDGRLDDAAWRKIPPLAPFVAPIFEAIAHKST